MKDLGNWKLSLSKSSRASIFTNPRYNFESLHSSFDAIDETLSKPKSHASVIKSVEIQIKQVESSECEQKHFNDAAHEAV